MFIRKNVLIGLIVLFLGVTIFFGFLIYQGKNQSFKNPLIKQQGRNSSTKQIKSYPEDLKGKVYLTLKDKKTQKMGIYAFNLDKDSLEKVYLPTEDCYVLGGEVSNDRKNMVITSDCGNKGKGSPQIKLLDFYNNEIKKEITKSGSFDKKESAWLPEGKGIIFMAYNEKFDELNFDPNGWRIYKSSLAGEEEFVGNAAHPFVSLNGKKMLALKTEGLYLFDMETKKGERVHDFKIKTFVSMQLDLSDEKDLLAISSPYTRDITIFKIKSWDNFEMEEINKIETTDVIVSWPKFYSENEKYIVAEELSRSGSGKIELVAYNLETKEKHVIFDLSDYEHGFMWINDWK